LAKEIAEIDLQEKWAELAGIRRQANDNSYV